MKLRTLLALVFLSLGVLVLMLVAIFLTNIKKEFELGNAAARKNYSYQLADELRESSDDLTLMARSYVVTGNDKYQRFFNRILAIRNGEAPRPKDYGDLYWDLLTEPEESGDVELGEKASLESLMLKAGFTLNEFALLKKSQSESDDLVKLENVAMHAIKGEFDDGTGTFQIKKAPDQALAIKIMYSPEYQAAKAKIMKPIKNFNRAVQQRNLAFVQKLELELEYRIIEGLVLALTLLVVLAIGYFSLLRLVLRPVNLLWIGVEQLEKGEYMEVGNACGVAELKKLIEIFNHTEVTLRQREKEKEAAIADLREKGLALEREKGRTEKLLLNVLPIAIVDRLQRGEKVEAETFPEVTVLFADIVGFTQMSLELGPHSVANLLNEVFEIFDVLAEKYKLEKIKTIGDCYMAVAGVPDRSPTHAQQMADFAIEALELLKAQNIRLSRNVEIRIGMHCGTVAAGIIGRKKFAYDLWGDVVNITSRLEGTAVPMKIHVSESVHSRLEDSYLFEERGEVELKNRGKLRTYFLIGKKTEKA
ncbi:MAG: adenylate/guanylate cyclase domain-containing protein [Chlamydiae bacterium]|nr:adenylate/guanylate cyclase domain-containing protein [Chlamydiota bacterium]